MTEDKMVGWHHQLSGHEFGQSLGDSEGQGSLASYSSWGSKESDMTQQLNDNNNKQREQAACAQKTPGWFSGKSF